MVMVTSDPEGMKVAKVLMMKEEILSRRGGGRGSCGCGR